MFAQPGRQPVSFDDLQGSICLRKWFVYSARLASGGSVPIWSATTRTMPSRCWACRYSTELIDAEWPVYLGILKTEAALIEAAEAFSLPTLLTWRPCYPNCPRRTGMFRFSRTGRAAGGQRSIRQALEQFDPWHEEQGVIRIKLNELVFGVISPFRKISIQQELSNSYDEKDTRFNPETK